MGNGPTMGGYDQGTPITRAPAPVREGGTPSKAGPARPAPRGEQHQQEAHKSTGRNGKTAH